MLVLSGIHTGSSFEEVSELPASISGTLVRFPSFVFLHSEARIAHPPFTARKVRKQATGPPAGQLAQGFLSPEGSAKDLPIPTSIPVFMHRMDSLSV